MSGQAFTKTQFSEEELLARSILYGALSLLLRHPDTLDVSLTSEENILLWQRAINSLEVFDKKKIKNALEGLLLALKSTPKEEWAHQYESHFGYAVHSAVPIYELEYGEEHSHRQPQQLSDITAFYKAFGLKLSSDIHERVDHIAIECEFMHFLIFKEVYALKNIGEEKAVICREAAQHFLSEHLGRWLPPFALRLSKHAKGGLLEKIADFAIAFVVQDCAILGIKPGHYDLPLRSIQENIETGCVSCTLNPDNLPR